MDDAANYRKKAEAAERQAVAAATAIMRETFLRVAQGWRDLAREAEEKALRDEPR